MIRKGYLDVAKQAARGPRSGWRENPDVPEERTLRDRVLLAGDSSIPLRSMEKTAFFMSPAEDAAAAAAQEQESALTSVALKPGTFVELRRYVGARARIRACV